MEHMEDMRNGCVSVSPSSSPPTPPSPLPISVGPGNQKYSFSPSPSPSPPFSPPPSSHTSAENLPLLSNKLATTTNVKSAFSLDLPHLDQTDSTSSCLQDLLEWFLQKCCNCCSKSVPIHYQKTREMQK
ncbi:vegetative cell wall protein gp1 [Hevea brasiliensis]|uniref:vegetative cell wall protein gp1 n=1 Tax=Hevea brasiliensis TaxID=3981 RepID=UPI0025D40F5F|nr:vegetative cell wall protein gp1 [Hevea brasiliensis]